jgi:DNA-binding NarL/FixJ family response regulator
MENQDLIFELKFLSRRGIFVIKVILVDDQNIILEGLKYMIEKDKNLKVVGTARNGKEALELCDKFSPNIVLMDLVMPECDGIEGTYLIKKKYSEIKVIILTTFEDEENISKALKNGADGYILKDVKPDALRVTLKSSFLGYPVIHKNVFNKVLKHYNNSVNKSKSIKKVEIYKELNENELAIINLIVDGKSTKEIALEMFLSEGRIRNILTRIFQKLEVMDRTQLAVFAIKNGIV